MPQITAVFDEKRAMGWRHQRLRVDRFNAGRAMPALLSNVRPAAVKEAEQADDFCRHAGTLRTGIRQRLTDKGYCHSSLTVFL